MGRPSFRRRKFFIKKEFQGKFIALYTIGVIALAGVTTLVLNSWLHDIVDEQLYSSHMKIQRTGELFLTPLIQTNLYAMMAISLVILFCSVVVFKRLNRHFMHMDEAFNAMTRGDYTSYAPPASHFEEINEIIDMVSKTQDVYAERTQELKGLMGEIKQSVDAGCPEAELKSLHEKLSAITGRMQLPDPS